MLEEYETSLKTLKNKIITIDKAISELYKDRADGVLLNEDFLSIKSELEKEKRECENKINDLEISINESKNILTDNKTKTKYINNFLNAKNPTKEMIKTLVNRIEISEDKQVKIFFNFNVNEVTNA